MELTVVMEGVMRPSRSVEHVLSSALIRSHSGLAVSSSRPSRADDDYCAGRTRRRDLTSPFRCGVKLPVFIWPLLNAEERAVRGGLAFDIALPVYGRLVRYLGKL
jgi:hypothetical protein